MEGLILQYGLVIIFFGAAIEGDVVFIAGGLLAQHGWFHWVTVYLLAVAGVFCGDSLWYLLGRWRGAWLRSCPFYRKVGPAAEKLAHRLGPFELAAARLIYGLRIASMIFWGMQRLPYRRFLAYNALGVLPWGIALTLMGYGLSGSVDLLVRRVKRFELGLLIALLAGWALFLTGEKLLRLWFNKKIND